MCVSMCVQVVTGLDNPRVEHPGTEWFTSLSTKNVKCYKRAVLTGAFGYVVRATGRHRTLCSRLCSQRLSGK